MLRRLDKGGSADLERVTVCWETLLGMEEPPSITGIATKIVFPDWLYLKINVLGRPVINS
jgi:hypothetical protein